MAEPPDEDVLVVPPIPLATGAAARTRRTTARRGASPSVEFVVSTEDGGELRIPLVHRHGAWWAP